jgi:hypothetical protein
MNTRCGLGRMRKSRDEKGWLLSLARGRRTGETEMELMQAWSSLTTRTLPASLSHPPLIMSQSRSPSVTEEQHSSQTTLLKESASDTHAADNNLCPNLDDEVSAARGAGVFVSLLPYTRSCCVHPCPAQISLYHRSGNARCPSRPQPHILMIPCV